MDTDTELRRYLSRRLHSLRSLLEDLPDRERRWGAVALADSTDEVIADVSSFRMEWQDDLDRLAGRVRAAYLEGRMTAEQEQQYHDVLRLLRQMTPVMERLDLDLPDDVVFDLRSSPPRESSPSPLV